ncbi:MAG: SDR family NAD(P)-dependent oxidoreductase, partial [Roseovarius sp.]|nr:SDR family NAD(P)-dependent oxidoreductase [Roseovarius sp.]
MSETKTLLLTGASRGIGHATVRRFNGAGWRVITCSRQPFPEECPWGGGAENHIQMDLADPHDVIAKVDVIRERLGGRLDALVNNAGISPKGPLGERL